MAAQAHGAAADDRVVILGGGIVGAATAYFLSKKGVKPLVVERTSVAAAASGKAGGFLARSWGDGGPTAQLHHLGFDLHAELASTLGVESYRAIETLSVAGGRKRRPGSEPFPAPASWLDGDLSRASLMDSNTAQVTPAEITQKMMDAALEAGAELRIGTVVGVETEADGPGRRVSGVKVAAGGGDPEVIPASKVVVALGPWSVLAEDWFPEELRVPVEGIKSTSIVWNSERVKSAVTKEPYALFCSEDNNGCHMEVYPRFNGEVYCCGLGGSDYVSGPRLRAGGDCEHQGLVQADPRRVQAGAASFAGLTTLGRDAEGYPAQPEVSQVRWV
jgi:glycine/D-amino acid oxidase-like deaminating enzyme